AALLELHSGSLSPVSWPIPTFSSMVFSVSHVEVFDPLGLELCSWYCVSQEQFLPTSVVIYYLQFIKACLRIQKAKSASSHRSQAHTFNPKTQD
ncbi:hypothetical protein ACQP3C_25895, partial [Escherichia coli]